MGDIATIQPPMDAALARQDTIEGTASAVMGALSAKDPRASVIGGVGDIATIQLPMDAVLARQDAIEGTASAVMGALSAKDPRASVI